MGLLNSKKVKTTAPERPAKDNEQAEEDSQALTPTAAGPMTVVNAQRA